MIGAALTLVWVFGAAAAGAEEVLLRLGNTTVPQGTIVYGDAIAVGGALDVAGTVTGNAIAAGGSVHVSGRVGGDVRAVAGDVILESTAIVGGGAQSAGGSVRVAPGAVVKGGAARGPAPSPGPPGQVPSVPPYPSPGPWPSTGQPEWLPPALFGILAMWKLLAGVVIGLTLVSFIGMTWLTAAVFPGATAEVAGILERDPAAPVVAGVLVWILLGPAVVLLVVSIAGIVLVPLLFMALFIAMQLGMSAVSVLVGHRVRPGRIAIEALLGAVLLAIAFAVPHLGWLAALAATTWGTGGVAMAIVERRRGWTPPAPAGPSAPSPSSPSSALPPTQ